MEKDSTTSAVISVAKEREVKIDEPITLRSGVRVYVRSVAASLIDQVTSKIKDPEPPTWRNEEKGRDEINYADPSYTRGMAEAERQRGVAAMDAIIMFGFDLVDDIPEDDLWLKKLAILGVEVDSKDPLQREFAYKKFVAISPDDIGLVTSRSGISAEQIEAAEKSFQR